MSVKKRGSVYWMYFTFNGKRIQESTKCKNKRDAEDVEAAYRTRLAKGEVGIEPKKEIPSFSQVAKEFLEWVKHERVLSASTKRSYTTTANHLLEFFKDTPVDRITPSDVEKYRQKRLRQKSPKTKRPLQAGTVNRELATLRVMFNRLIKNDLLVKNPVSKVKFLAENLERWRVISEHEERLYLMAATQPLKDIAILMLECGCRPEELFRLERKNVNLDEGYLFVPFGKTKSARRRIPLTNRAAKVLELRLKRNSDYYVFANEKTGKPITGLKKGHAGAIKRSGLTKFRLYDLRHTFASRFIEAGGDVVTLAALLGHSSIAIVTRYAHPIENHKIESIKQMEKVRLAKSG